MMDALAWIRITYARHAQWCARRGVGTENFERHCFRALGRKLRHGA